MSPGPPEGGPLAQVDGIDRVAGPLSHELGQHVAVLSGALGMLRDHGGADAEALRMIGGVEERLRLLTEDLLSYSRKPSG